jgi:endonuclease/exonuclease/phosphatase family metal-dependent hydrolase
VILSRWPIAERRQLREDFVRPPLFRPSGAESEAPVHWDRPLLAARVELPNVEPLWVVNLHLRATIAAALPGAKIDSFSWRSVGGWAEGFYLAAMKRSGQALEARLFAESLFDENPAARVVICGDLNAEEQEMPLRILRADLDDTGNGALSARVMTPLERSLPDWRRFSVIHAGRKTMLDHILASRSLVACFKSIELHNEALGDELSAYALVGHSPESYHAPLVAEFDL